MRLQKLMVVVGIVFAMGLAVVPALGAEAPAGLHKSPAAIRVVHGPAGGTVCVRCHPAPCAACHP